MISIEQAGWYAIDKTLAGDSGLRFPVTFLNIGKLPAMEVKAIQHMVLIIKTDTIERYPNYVDDITNISEILDPDKEKRINEQYIPYREKPFVEISKFIFDRKNIITNLDIINYFSNRWQSNGYMIQTCGELEDRDFGTMLPDRGRKDERGRSLSIETEQEILKVGSNILIFYYAIEYKSPLNTKRYITKYLGCYDSFSAQKDSNRIHLYTNNKISFDEIESMVDRKPQEKRKGITMEIIRILPENHRLAYIMLILGISLVIRFILCLFKVCAIRHKEKEAKILPI